MSATLTRFGVWHAYLTFAARVTAKLGYRGRAMEMYADIAKQWPKDGLALAAIGHLYGADGNHVKAREWLEKSIAIDSNSQSAGAAHFNLGYLCDKNNDFDGAVFHFQKAVAFNPKIDRAWYGLGLVLVKLHRELEAKKAFQQVVEIDPMNKHGWYQLGMTHLALGEEKEFKGVIDHTCHFDPKIAAKLDEDSKAFRKQQKEERVAKEGAADRATAPAPA
jgi:tetratricopeptide (TPR) repeat protein